ncbi:C-type lectin domain family 17, member A-like [Sphaerodactylus townsendi]|uniref:C-type lectin domain family 17, member A-like n=1 Tax=Sphaerodactylus townsendi TaxID=933632 RepID=UPI00202769A0|nr:C-type lectin domain family 17, member A-like [Sphaerodactylus townsendi]
METSYTKWDNSEQVSVLMERQDKAKESKDTVGFHVSEFIKRKVVIYCVILGIGYFLITVLLSLSLRNESEMSKAIEMRNTWSSDSSQMLFNLSKEVSGIGLKVDLLQAESGRESAGAQMTDNTIPLLQEVAKLRDENRRIAEDVTQMLVELRNRTGAQMTDNTIPLLQEVAKLRDENRRIAEDVTQMLVELRNWTEFSCTKCPPNWMSFEKNCYFFSTVNKPWTIAKQSCENEGAHLVIINNHQEMRFLVRLTDEVFWMGLSDAGSESQWIWVDGTPLTLAYWGKGEPNNAGHGEDCATLPSNGKWNDVSCSRNERWICERKC